MTNLRDSALEYALAGFPVFPLKPMGKRPIIEHGFKVATREVPLIAAWWNRNPNANIGMATGPLSGILVLDVDPEHGGSESLGALPERQLTWVVETPSGGWHYWYRYPAGGRLGNTAGKLGPGLDTRGDGGYVVIPPSIGHNGRAYEWVIRDELSEVPGWMVEALLPPPAPPVGDRKTISLGARATNYGRRALEGLADDMLAAAEGTRNDTLLAVSRRAGRLEAAGEIEASLAEDVIIAAALGVGLPTTEAVRTFESGFEFGRQYPAMRVER